MKYKRLEDEGTLRGKLHKFNIHSIRKKGDRFAGYLKILTGVEPQVKDASSSVQKKCFVLSSRWHLLIVIRLYFILSELWDRFLCS